MADILNDCNCGGQTAGFISDGTIHSSNLDVCGDITIDLLQQYRRPIQCYIDHDLSSSIDASKTDLLEALAMLDTYIAAKRIDPNTCDHKEVLPAIQHIVSKIIIKGQCL